MATKKKAAEKIDPTLLFSKFELDGKTYEACFDFGLMAKAEHAMEKTDPDVSLLECSWNAHKLRNLRILFAASLEHRHSDLSFEERMNLVTWANAGAVLVQVRIAQGLFAPKPDEDKDAERPPEAPASE